MKPQNVDALINLDPELKILCDSRIRNLKIESQLNNYSFDNFLEETLTD
jgi:hypothetical protein